jgi:pimeloyl-ACP methyl ester carboxylesterase
VRGVRHHYAEAGSGEPLVLLHGWPQHWWTWREVIGPLSRRFRVICPDMRGFGWSDAPRDGYRKDELAEDLIALLDALDIGRTRLVGHDWGGFVGFLACMSRPARFERFIALSITPPWPPAGPPSPLVMLRLSYQLVIAAPGLGPLALTRLGLPKLLLNRAREAGSFTDEEIETYAAVIRSPAGVHTSVEMYRNFLLHELPELSRGRYRSTRLETSTLLLMGDRDPVRVALAESYDRYADDLEIEFVPGAGHFLPEERPDLVVERAMEFLERR